MPRPLASSQVWVGTRHCAARSLVPGAAELHSCCCCFCCCCCQSPNNMNVTASLACSKSSHAVCTPQAAQLGQPIAQYDTQWHGLLARSGWLGSTPPAMKQCMTLSLPAAAIACTSAAAAGDCSAFTPQLVHSWPRMQLPWSSG
jgi:hypothetical protein